MRCAVSSGAGQVLATGQLFIQENEAGHWYLSFRSDRGRVIQGGPITADGDMTQASQDLFRQFFLTWGVAGVTLTMQVGQQVSSPY